MDWISCAAGLTQGHWRDAKLLSGNGAVVRGWSWWTGAGGQMIFELGNDCHELAPLFVKLHPGLLLIANPRSHQIVEGLFVGC